MHYLTFHHKNIPFLPLFSLHVTSLTRYHELNTFRNNACNSVLLICWRLTPSLCRSYSYTPHQLPTRTAIVISRDICFVLTCICHVSLPALRVSAKSLVLPWRVSAMSLVLPWSVSAMSLVLSSFVFSCVDRTRSLLWGNQPYPAQLSVWYMNAIFSFQYIAGTWPLVAGRPRLEAMLTSGILWVHLEGPTIPACRWDLRGLSA